VKSARHYRQLVINGRFLGAKPTGVQRVARQLLLALQQHQHELDALFANGVTVCAPHNVTAVGEGNTLRLDAEGKLTGQAWEQIELPRRASGKLLLSLCNLAPIASKNAITMIHDAQVYTMPSSYSRAFRQWYRLVLPRIGHRHLQILTVSEFSARQLVEFGVAPADRITVIHNGVDHVLAFTADPSVNQAHGLARHGYVVALASTQHHKNIGVLLRAFEQGLMGDTRLVLIGGTGATEFAAAGLAVPPGTVFAGKVSDGQMRALMEDALCFAMPSLTEGFGLPPLEAMMLGCPAVLAPCGALPEVCGEAALYADPHDPAAWTEAMRRLRAAPDLRERLVDAGRVQSGQFTWAAAGRRLVETLKRFAAPHAA
jgi:glycosyltransferase involved in cell wall biosynthesis